MGIAILMVFSSFAGFLGIVGPAYAVAGDLTITTSFTIEDTIYYIDGDLLIQPTGTLTIRNAEMRFVSDDAHQHSVNVNGGNLILENGVITTYLDQVNTYPFLTMTVQAGGDLIASDDSIISFPGDLIITGATTKVNLSDTIITALDGGMLSQFYSGVIDEADDGPSISIDDSTVELYDSKILSMPEYIGAPLNLTLTGKAQLTAVNSYIDVDFVDPGSSFWTHNKLIVSDDAKAYLYGCTFAGPPSTPYGDSAVGATDGMNIAYATAKATWDNATGQLLSSLYTAGDLLYYTVTPQRNMAVTTFDISSVSSKPVAVWLLMNFSADVAYAGNRPVNYTLGGSTLSTGIIPVAGNNGRLAMVDMYARGVDTLAEAQSLRISFLNNGPIGSGDVQFDALYLIIQTRPQVYIYRWADVTLADKYGVPLAGATLSAKFTGSTELEGQDAFYIVPPAATKQTTPPGTVLAYMGKTAANYRTADANGKVLVPFLTDWINWSTDPNSLVAGVYKMTGTYGVNTTTVEIALPAYPEMNAEDAVASIMLSIENAIASSWDTSKYIIVPPSLTISNGAYTHLGDIIVKPTGTLTLQDLDFMIYRSNNDTSRVIVDTGGTLRIINATFESNSQIEFDIRAGATLMIHDSTITSNADFMISGNADVEIMGSSIGGMFETADDASASLDLEDVSFANSPLISGTSSVILMNVSAPSIDLEGQATAYLHRWVMAMVVDITDSPLPAATVYARFQLNNTLYTSAVTSSSGVASLRLPVCMMEASGGSVTTTYYGNYNLTARFTANSIDYYSSPYKVSLTPYTEPLEVDNLNILISIPVGLPDLTIGSGGIYAFPPQPTEGVPCTLNAMISNIGYESASDIPVFFYYDVIDGGHLIGSTTVSVNAGSFAIAWVSWANPIKGNRLIIVSINPAQTISERNYNNNLDSTIITVLSKSDLIISDMYVVWDGAQVNLPGDFPAETDVEFHAVVYNQGDTTVTPPILVALFNGSIVPSRLIDTKTISNSIGLGGTVELVFTMTLPRVIGSSVDYSYIVIVNPNSTQVGFATTQKTESNYLNNSYSATLHIYDSRPDPAISRSDIVMMVGDRLLGGLEGNNVSYGDEISILLTVHNYGFFPANQVSVSINITGNDTLTHSITEIIDVDYITVNGTTQAVLEIIYSVKVNYSGKYKIEISLDLEDAIDDKNRLNNYAFTDLNVSYIEPIIQILPPGNVTVGEILRVVIYVMYPDQRPMKNWSVRVELRTATGAAVLTPQNLRTDNDGQVIASFNIPATQAPGTYAILVTVGQNSATQTFGIESAVGAGLEFWMIILIIAGVAAAVIAFSIYIYKQGIGKLVECGECGALIPESAKKCPKCGVEFEPDMVKCSECGAWIPAASVECPNCHVRFGAPLEGEKTYEEKMRDQYDEEVLSKYRDLAKIELGGDYNEDTFKSWWETNPAFIGFEDWLAKEEERRKKANLITCPVCGTPNAKDATTCQNCGSSLGGGEEGGAPPGPPAAPGGVVVEKRVIRKPIDRKVVPKKVVIKRPLDQTGGEQEEQ